VVWWCRSDAPKHYGTLPRRVTALHHHTTNQVRRLPWATHLRACSHKRQCLLRSEKGSGCAHSEFFRLWTLNSYPRRFSNLGASWAILQTRSDADPAVAPAGKSPEAEGRRGCRCRSPASALLAYITQLQEYTRVRILLASRDGSRRMRLFHRRHGSSFRPTSVDRLSHWRSHLIRRAADVR
jgi:hypothetical protein